MREAEAQIRNSQWSDGALKDECPPAGGHSYFNSEANFKTNRVLKLAHLPKNIFKIYI
jgi:hypothetical protein